MCVGHCLVCIVPLPLQLIAYSSINLDHYGTLYCVQVSMLDINKEAGERALKHFQKKHKDSVVFMLVDVTVKEQLVIHTVNCSTSLSAHHIFHISYYLTTRWQSRRYIVYLLDCHTYCKYALTLSIVCIVITKRIHSCIITDSPYLSHTLYPHIR